MRKISKNKYLLLLIFLLIVLFGFESKVYAHLLDNTCLNRKTCLGTIKSKKIFPFTYPNKTNKNSIKGVSGMLNALISAVVSATVTISLFIIGRKRAIKQLEFDVALKNLLPDVYSPILTELKFYEVRKEKINFAKIESVILNNYTLIRFAPKVNRSILLNILSICNKIKDEKTYECKKESLVKELKKLSENITIKFGAFIK